MISSSRRQFSSFGELQPRSRLSLGRECFTLTLPKGGNDMAKKRGPRKKRRVIIQRKTPAGHWITVHPKDEEHLGQADGGGKLAFAALPGPMTADDADKGDPIFAHDAGTLKEWAVDNLADGEYRLLKDAGTLTLGSPEKRAVKFE